MSIDDFDEMKILHEMEQYDDIMDWAEDKAEENEEFWGDDLNEEKNERLTRMREACIKLTEIDRDIKHKYQTFDNSNQNGTVQIVFPGIYFSPDKRVTDVLSKLCEDADHIWLSSMNGKITMTFAVADMWNIHGTKADRKK